MEKSQLRRVIRERNQLSDDESDQIVRVLRDYSDGRLEKREAAQQLRGYVPHEQQASLLGLDLDDLLPVVLALIGGRELQGRQDLGSLIGRTLGGQDGRLDIGDLLGGLLGGGRTATPRNDQGDLDVRGLVGDLLNRRDDDNRPTSSGGIGDLLGGLLGGTAASGQGGIGDLLGGLLGGEQRATNDDNDDKRDHNLRKRR